MAGKTFRSEAEYGTRVALGLCTTTPRVVVGGGGGHVLSVVGLAMWSHHAFLFSLSRTELLSKIPGLAHCILQLGIH